ncbi:hypothetical protein BBJ29_008057 [Phytophthora kernoviae]|uniref:Tyrosinase copper-binding domain-containing protein n=1 Tax=Phytophthora kernoviae TaxID=325452 RepID=A0A3F2RED1_9STRA|nr:hypothetical protein BBP00_00009481 [Phytophthora kernoviae]RLN70658.1 hypothetical protein BBJ29_008057 [Phytophthora kernoviae]
MGPRQAKRNLLAILLSIFLLVSSSCANVWPTDGVCGSRVRYSWDSLTPADKTLYHNAITAAMTSGYHALFTEVHSDLASFKEAHNTCGMMYWHRRFLFAYEDMLRSLDTKFACITIPYWDYFADYAKLVTNLCTTLEGCSTLLQEFGGSNGPLQTLSINGFTVSGKCVDGLDSHYANYTTFCEKSTMSGASCSGCIPRGSWSTTLFPSGICYSSLAQYLSLQYGYSWFSQNIHYGLHQTIHNAAMGAMASYPTSADPIFFSHHATVDLIQQLYFNCQIGQTLTDNEKKYGSYSFQSCATTGYPYTSPTSLSTMTMYWNGVGQTRTAVENHPRLKRFFAYQPKEYWRYVSASDLGNMSYTTKSIGRTFNLYQDIRNAALANTSSKAEAMAQGETLDCLWYDENYGVEDFNSVFRANWKISSSTHTLCYNRVQDVKYGRRRVKVADWREKYSFHYHTMTDAELASASDISPTEETAMIGGSEASANSAAPSLESTTATESTTTTPIPELTAASSSTSSLAGTTPPAATTP